MLSEAFLQRLDALQLRMRHPSVGGGGGLRRSKAQGSSVEFSDFREYAAGDDIRRLDWNAYARFDKLFVKLFMEEQEASVNLVVDASASMQFGEPSKWHNAVQLAETLAYLALGTQDRVTLYALSGEKVQHTRPLTGRQGYMEAAEFLAGLKPQGNTQLSAVMPRLPLAVGRGIAVVLSDFLSPDGYQRALQSLLYRKQEGTALQILTREEVSPSLEDVVRLVDSETGEALELLASYDTLQRYQQTAEGYIRDLRGYCHQNGMGYALVYTEDDFEQRVLRQLVKAGLLQ